MDFFNGTTLEDFIDKDVHVILTSNTNACDTLPLCYAFIHEGKLCIDLIPQLNRKYVVEVPDDSILSKNDEELSMGRYGIVIREGTVAGRIIRSMLEQKRKMEKR
jgi:hypothetical protein